jgi:polyphosphate:AMP phosphotransferase
MMFRTAELGRKVSKDDFAELAPSLRTEMLELQFRLRNCPFPVIVVFAGVDGAGKGESVNLLNEWMDPRWIESHAYGEPSDEERERPEFWRYWRDLPGNGRIGLFLSSWYSAPVLDRAHGRISDAELDERLREVAAFEKMLADDGALILKFWMHLGKDAQKQRLKKLEKDPLESWRVTDRDWKHWEMYDQFIAAAERTIRVTSAGNAPWAIVEGTDARYRSLTVLTSLRDAMNRHMEAFELKRRVAEDLRRAEKEQAAASGLPVGAGHHGTGMLTVSLPHQPTILQALDMTQSLDKDVYNDRLQEGRARLHRLYRLAQDHGLSTVLMFEGWDAAGKGGAIRRMTNALDARHYKVIPVAAPTDEERSHHYLWRFWRHIARAGRFTIFDRSWYGRVLVERVEGYASTDEWMRAYNEINTFEEQLVDNGVVLGKFWLHITAEEQLKRFELRKETPWKSWKLTDEDWRNREKWSAYETAVNEMVERTSTSKAPWTLVEANCKNHARVKVIETVGDKLEAALLRIGALPPSDESSKGKTAKKKKS